MIEEKPLTESIDWLDEQEFYEYCQAYRYSGWDTSRAMENAPISSPTATEALEALKKYIREKIADEIYVARTFKG